MSTDRNAFVTKQKLANGRTRVTVSQKPIQFLRNGQWRPFDRAWRRVGSVYVCEGMPFRVQTLADGVGFTYTTDDGVITCRLQGSPDTRRATVTDNAVWFSGVRPGVDVGFVVGRNGVRTVKRLHSADAARAFTWDVESTGEPGVFRHPVGRDNENETKGDSFPVRRDLELSTAQTPAEVTDGVARWTVTEAWSGRVKTYTKPDRIPQWTEDPAYPVTMDPTFGPSAADADDGTEIGGTWSNSNYVMSAGFSSGIPRHAGVRFTNVTVPQGATITAATLTFDVESHYPGGFGADLIIRGDDVDDAEGWSDSSKPSSGFTATTAEAPWNDAGISTGDVPITVTDIVQEIVSRPGWASGNGMRFAAMNNDADSRVVYLDASDEAGNETRLTIEYTEGGGPAWVPRIVII